MKYPAALAFDKILAADIAAFLRQLGFHQTNVRTFHKPMRRFHAIVQFRGLLPSRRQSLDYRIITSLTLPAYHEMIAGTRFPQDPTRAKRIVEFGIENYLPYHYMEMEKEIASGNPAPQYTSEFHIAADPDHFYRDMRNVLENHALPHLKTFASLQALIRCCVNQWPPPFGHVPQNGNSDAIRHAVLLACANRWRQARRQLCATVPDASALTVWRRLQTRRPG